MTSGKQSPAGDPEKTTEPANEGQIRYLCMKYNVHQEGDRMACRDPDLYCKFRPACLIHYQEKRRRRQGENA